MNDQEPHYHGHRSRLRARLMASALGELPDYEILELLLTLTRPRGDVKPLAKELLAKYGSLSRLLYADPEVLAKENGIGEVVIASFRIVLEASVRLIKEEVMDKTIVESWQSLLNYCRATMGHIKTEQFRVIYLNKKNMIISDELQDTGTVDQIHIYPREIVKKALFLGASALILIHNHPTGNTKPSKADIELTKLIAQICELLGISLHDHIIISSNNHYSFKAHGLM